MKIDGWCVVELMGHRRLVGRVTETELAGTGMLEVEVHTPDGTVVTQVYSPQALYCLTPITEDSAMEMLPINVVNPVHRWELPHSVDTKDMDAEADDYADGDDDDHPF